VSNALPERWNTVYGSRRKAGTTMIT